MAAYLLSAGLSLFSNAFFKNRAFYPQDCLLAVAFSVTLEKG
jgi:hypothetical protein